MWNCEICELLIALLFQLLRIAREIWKRTRRHFPLYNNACIRPDPLRNIIPRALITAPDGIQLKWNRMQIAIYRGRRKHARSIPRLFFSRMGKRKSEKWKLRTVFRNRFNALKWTKTLYFEYSPFYKSASYNIRDNRFVDAKRNQTCIARRNSRLLLFPQ